MVSIIRAIEELISRFCYSYSVLLNVDNFLKSYFYDWCSWGAVRVMTRREVFLFSPLRFYSSMWFWVYIFYSSDSMFLLLLFLCISKMCFIVLFFCSSISSFSDLIFRSLLNSVFSTLRGAFVVLLTVLFCLFVYIVDLLLFFS